MIYFAKKNSRLFLDPKRAKKYRATDNLQLDEAEYKRMFDPITPMGGGGEAKYVVTDWQANPIYLHLKDIVKAEIQRTSKQLEVNLTDKFAKTRKMRDSYRQLYKGLFRSLINEYAPLVGLQGISDSQDPYKWAQNLMSGNKDGQGDKQAPQGNSDIIDGFVDLIKNHITDDQDLAAYNELIYKGDYEIAFEKGIQYYLLNLNKWDERWSDEFIDDIMHFNKAAGEIYTDLMTGRPVVERFIPEILYTSPFKRRDGEDLMYYFIEYEITFADFARSIGRNLDPSQLKDVFEYNKSQGSSHGLSWIEWTEKPNKVRDDAMIRVGKMAALTQDYEVYMDAVDTNYPRYQQVDLSWKEKPNTPNKYKARKDEKHFNVWYSWYYIPPTTEHMSNADYAWQAQFIFDIKKNQDQERYGEDGRYSKSPLVIYDNSRQASFSDRVQYWMPKIHYASMQYQNCLINDIDATIASDDLLTGLLAAVDEDNKISAGDPSRPTGGNGKNAYMQQWDMIKQRSAGFLNMVDRQGNPVIDPSKLLLKFKNDQIERAGKYMAEIAIMYNNLVQAIAMNDARQGQDTKPRTPVAALNESIKSSDNATFFVTKGYETFLKTYAERIVRFIIRIGKDAKTYGFTKLLDEFKSVVGEAFGLTVDGMEDIPPESVGLTVNYTDNSAKKDFVMNMATEFIKQGQLDNDFLYLILGADNWKLSFLLMRIGIKKRKQEKAHEQEVQQQYIMQQKDADLKIAMALQGAKGDSKDKNIMTQGKVDEMVNNSLNAAKAETQQKQKQQLLNNKLEQQEHAADLQQQSKAQDALAGSQ